MKSLPRLLLAVRLRAGRAIAESLSVSTTNFAAAVSPEIVIEGRYAPSPTGAVRLGFCGTAVLHFRCHGS
jgi:hypothetical protein